MITAITEQVTNTPPHGIAHSSYTFNQQNAFRLAPYTCTPSTALAPSSDIFTSMRCHQNPAPFIIHLGHTRWFLNWHAAMCINDRIAYHMDMVFIDTFFYQAIGSMISRCKMLVFL